MVTSAGLLLFREREPGGALEVLVAHMGGPLWARKDAGAWTIPKGVVEPGEEPFDAALREFREELGLAVPAAAPGVPDVDLGSVRQGSGKTVVAWARRGDLDLAGFAPGTFTMTWPPRSGRTQEFPEVDRAAWLLADDARGLVVAAQAALVDRLVSAVRG